MQRAWIIAGAVMAMILIVAGTLLWLVRTNDAAKVVYKRFMAENEHVYERVPDAFKATDPARLIRFSDRSGANDARQRLAEAVLGPGARQRLADARVRPEAAEGHWARSLDHAGRVNAYRIDVDWGYRATIVLVAPEDAAHGRLVLYHHGYAGSAADADWLVDDLLRRGYHVALLNIPGYGQNRLPVSDIPGFGRVDFTNDNYIHVLDHPLRLHFEPIVTFLNSVVADFASVDMIGLSAGGWAATIAAAIDTRIRRTWTVAGGYPLYVRLYYPENQSAPPFLYRPMLHAANYIEMYVLAALGEGRALHQTFNRYDRCCYRNLFGKLWEPAVRSAVERLGPAGDFSVSIDETHPDHKISRWAWARIVNALEKD